MRWLSFLLLACCAALGCARSHAFDAPPSHSLFVGVGPDGHLAVSADGVSWDAVETGITDSFSDVAFGGGLIVALTSTGRVVASTNGIAWREVGSVSAFGGTSTTGAGWTAVGYAGGRFLAVGYTWEDGAFGAVSPNGVAWTEVELPPFRPDSITPTADDSFVVSGGLLSDLPETEAYLLEGTTVERIDAPALSSGVVVDGRVYALANGEVVSSVGGRTWEMHGVSVAPYPREITWGAGRFVVVGERSMIRYSTDLVSWDDASVAVGDHTWFPEAAFGAGTFVAVGAQVVSSVDGAATWEPRDDAGDLVAVVFADLLPTEAPDAPAGPPCPADYEDHCGDFYCESCVDGVLYRCSSIGPTDELPAC